MKWWKLFCVSYSLLFGRGRERVRRAQKMCTTSTNIRSTLQTDLFHHHFDCFFVLSKSLFCFISISNQLSTMTFYAQKIVFFSLFVWYRLRDKVFFGVRQVVERMNGSEQIHTTKCDIKCWYKKTKSLDMSAGIACVFHYEYNLKDRSGRMQISVR